MHRNIITISREFGSGGRTIGKLAAERLGIPCYDKDLVKQVAAETGFAEGFVEQTGEYAPVGSFLAYIFANGGGQGTPGELSPEDRLWVTQSKVIHDLAEQGPCVLVGRCADYVLRDREDVLHVFIHADMAHRAERIVQRYGETDKSPEKRLEEQDRKRRIYCKRYTDRDWGRARDYHIALDSGVIGIESCVALITALMK